MNVLAIGAHFDDLELGCGGTLARHSQCGDKVYGYIATTSQYSNKEGKVVRAGSTAEQEARNASGIIGYELILGNIPTFYLEYGEDVNAQLVKLIEEKQIELVYTHWIYDVHHDHRNLALATLHAARHINKILMYRSNWYSSEKEFEKNFYVDITETWKVKEESIKAYQSEYKRVGTKWIDYFEREALNDGLRIGTKYAEGFQVIKWTL